MSPDRCSLYLHQAPWCSWLLDSEGRFLQIYGDSAPILGVSARALTGRAMREAFSSDASEIWKERIARALAGETLRLRERRGSTTWYVVLFPLRTQGEPAAGAGGLALDVTPWSTADQELRHTVLGALRAQEFERNTTAKFLHDSVGQNLSAIGLHLDLLRMDLESVSPDACKRIGEIQQTLETMMEEVREFSYGLNPAMVERAGLHAALDRLAGRVRSRFQGGLRLMADPSLKVPARYAPALYQIAQEAVENALQHSGCSLIEIAVKSTRTGLSLEVRDNGKGFDPADVVGASRGLGLLSMEHFAVQAGLDLTITSARTTGTIVRATTAEPGS
jgi:two-component system NarL family sensor kinase